MAETPAPLGQAPARVPLPDGFDASRGRKEIAIGARGLDRIEFGRDDIDLRVEKIRKQMAQKIAQ